MKPPISIIISWALSSAPAAAAASLVESEAPRLKHHGESLRANSKVGEHGVRYGHTALVWCVLLDRDVSL
jgi:hypothetical protein